MRALPHPSSFQPIEKRHAISFIGWLILKFQEGEVKLKEYMCAEVKHHKNVGKTIEEWQKNGWRLHTYQVTGRDVWINHYLLFEKGE